MDTDGTGFHGFYPYPSVQPVFIRVLLNRTRMDTDDTGFHGFYPCLSVQPVFIRVPF